MCRHVLFPLTSLFSSRILHFTLINLWVFSEHNCATSGLFVLPDIPACRCRRERRRTSQNVATFQLRSDFCFPLFPTLAESFLHLYLVLFYFDCAVSSIEVLASPTGAAVAISITIIAGGDRWRHVVVVTWTCVTLINDFCLYSQRHRHPLGDHRTKSLPSA